MRPVRVGVDIPYFATPPEIRDYVQAVEGLGFHHVGFSEHLCSTLDSDFPAPVFSFDDPWHESFTLASFLAAVTSTIELNPAMLLLPLYPPVLAAKQAAEVDSLSGGRLRIGASIGWNERECQSLGVDPASRGARFEEQVVVMRRLWAERAVDHGGRFFELSQTGINPARNAPSLCGSGRVRCRRAASPAPRPWREPPAWPTGSSSWRPPPWIPTEWRPRSTSC